MAKVSVNQLKQWFVTGSKPLQAQYYNWMDSYWHKDEYISQSQIDGLSDSLANKADTEQLQYYAKTDASNIDAVKFRNALGVGEVDLSNYYNKTEVDNLIQNVTVDLSDYHTISQYQQWINERNYITATEFSAGLNNRYAITTTNITAPDSTYFYAIITSAGGVTRRLDLQTYLNSNYANLSNLITAWGTPTNIQIPSAKLVKDSIDALVTGLIQPYKTISGNVTLDNSYHNAIVDITANATITVPNDLRTDFNCVFDAIGSSVGTFVEGSGLPAMSSPFGKVLRDNAMATLRRFGSTFRINGGLLPA